MGSSATLADKMRRLRMPTRSLHTQVVVWLIAIAVTMVIFAFILNNLIFAVLIL